MKTRSSVIVLLAIFGLFVMFELPDAGLAQDLGNEKSLINERLDQLHALASSADFEAYFDLYADGAIFMGTDATERWTLDEFKTYARPGFNQGRGWTYTATSRNIYIAADRRTAWFDELLHNESLGVTRGTGVLIKTDDGWRIVQYNLTIPVPNQLAREFVARIRELSAGDG